MAPSTRQNPALQVTADRKLRIIDAPILKPGPEDVLIHIKATGICGSDIHFWKAGRIGPLIFDGDCILGHEAAGIVVDVGGAVRNFKKGDRVALEPSVSCGTCFLCKDGRYNLCESVKFAGVYPHDGTLQRFKVHPEKWTHKIPSNISYSQASLLEPLSVVLQGLQTSPLRLGCGVLICGAGPIGLIAAASARASGAHPIVITDLAPTRLEFAKSFIPRCETYLIDRDAGAEGNAERIRKLFGEGEYVAPNTVLECTGVEDSILTGCHVVRRGGTVVVIGVGKSVMNNLPFMHLSMAEINLKFINRYRDTWPAGISALSGGVLDLDRLVTHRFPLERAVEALELCSDITKGSIKVQVVDEEEYGAPRGHGGGNEEAAYSTRQSKI
ncbi:hypothetical protein FQN54_000453 [Arachnomyces sp. PD_36]|nr:hypothetical protein FQN54_000453 [Arachnomyces sp. PD_36]